VSAKIEDQEGCGDGSDLAPSRQGAKIAWRLGVFARDLALSNLSILDHLSSIRGGEPFHPFSVYLLEALSQRAGSVGNRQTTLA